MPVILRSATLDDVPAILAIEQQAESAAHWPPDEYEKLVRTGVVIVAGQVAEQAAERVAEQAGHPTAAEQTGKLCGFVCAKAMAGEWEIENVVVAGEFLRRGIADRLMQALLDQAQNGAASRILLEVRESNRPARRLYEKHRFREVGRRRQYYRNPPEDAILYALRRDSDDQR
jgi:ribosomal-protein-alanine N-acetyltransferase